MVNFRQCRWSDRAAHRTDRMSRAASVPPAAGWTDLAGSLRPASYWMDGPCRELPSRQSLEGRRQRRSLRPYSSCRDEAPRVCEPHGSCTFNGRFCLRWGPAAATSAPRSSRAGSCLRWTRLRRRAPPSRGYTVKNSRGEGLHGRDQVGGANGAPRNGRAGGSRRLGTAAPGDVGGVLVRGAWPGCRHWDRRCGRPSRLGVVSANCDKFRPASASRPCLTGDLAAGVVSRPSSAPRRPQYRA